MKTFSFLLILCLLEVLLLPAYAQAATFVFPAQLQQIEAEAFWNDASLETVILPDGVTGIGAYAFAGSGLRSINLSGPIRSIADTAFQNCTGLTASVESGTYGSSSYTSSMPADTNSDRRITVSEIFSYVQTYAYGSGSLTQTAQCYASNMSEVMFWR